ncbi:MAG: hypothetical protein RXR09_05955 [Acidilobus sp.]
MSSLPDIARLASSMVSYSIVMPIYRYVENGYTYYFIQTTYRDYYKFYGIPIIYFFRSRFNDEELKYKYVLLKVDETGERVELSDRSRPGWAAMPIVNLKGRPSFIQTS